MADELKAEVIPLDGGLDFVTGKPLVKPGTLLDCLNYETVDRIGYKVIDGFNRYDGRPSPALAGNTYMEISDVSYVGTLSSVYPVGSLLQVTAGEIFGIVVALDEATNTIKYARVNQDYEPAAGDTVQNHATSAGAFQPDATPATGQITDGDAQDYVDAINSYSSSLRSSVTSLHDTPIGLHWFRDRLYAVVDERAFGFVNGFGEVKPNQYILGANTGAQGRILHVEVTSGDYGTGDAAGHVLYELLSSTDFGTSEVIEVYTDDTFVTQVAGIGVVTAGVGATEPVSDYAGLWQSRTYQQAIDELNDYSDAGWKKIDLGWELNYVDGFSEAGQFTRIQRGVDNNFTFESDNTSVTGTDGRTVTYVNGAKIPTDQPGSTSFGSTKVYDGAPGWKSTADTTVFADDIETELESVDASYIFGDVMWTGGGDAFSDGDLEAFRQGAIYGPTDNILSGWTVAGVDTDLYSCNARAPLIFKDFSTIAAQIPDNAVLNGIEVSLDYQTKNTYRATVRTTLDPHTNVPAWVDNQLSFSAYIGDYSASANTFTPQGSKQTTTCEIEATPANYTTTTGTPNSADVAIHEGVATLASQTATIGGDGNVFGTDILTKESLLDNSFSLAVFVDLTVGNEFPGGSLGSYTTGGSTTFYENIYGITRVSLNKIRIKVYYTLPSVRYYFKDADGNICTADLVYYTVFEGDLTGGTAEGTWQVVNITPVTTVTEVKRTILKGDTIHVAVPTGANQVAKVDDAEGTETGEVGMTLNGLASKNSLLAADGRYQFVTANFYAKDEWDGFFGVSGADRAFSFSKFDADDDGSDEEYVLKITTNTLDVEGDKPRHVAYYHGHLALGFSSGSVRLSVDGEPEDFSGEFGAADISVGDRISGLLTLKGTTLGVFCENSIWAITGTSIDNYGTQVLSPSTGALEYTVVDIGEPVYADNRGISTLSQSEKYGDFAGTRLSAAISPWILPRLVKNKNLFSVANGAGVVCALPVRGKNQYRLFFRDGYVLTMTMSVGDQPPEFTIQKYFLGQTDVTQTSRFLVPVAWSAQVDDRGVDRIHVAHYSPISDAPAATHSYVYELDSGWSFDGNYIPHHFVLNWHPLESPLIENTLRKIRLDGLSKGYSSLKMSGSKDYETTFSTTKIDISLPRNASSELFGDFTPVTNIGDINVRGRIITVKFEGVIPDGNTITDPEPSHICQVLVAWFTGGKQDG